MKMRRILVPALVFAMLAGFCAGAAAATLTLPADLKTVGNRAFYGDTSLDEVVLPEGTERIEALAFAYSGVKRITIPATVISIAENAFEGVTGLTIVAPAGSAAEAFYWAQHPELQDWSVGGTVYLGRYEQDNDLTNGKEGIRWRVLDVAGDQGGRRVLLLSEYGLDNMPYHNEQGPAGSPIPAHWKDCSLRSWLNGDFINAAFNASEQAAILTTAVDNSSGQGYEGRYPLEITWTGGEDTEDRVFLLSVKEAIDYLGGVYRNDLWFADDGITTPTAYAQAQGSNTGSSKIGWWLRSPGYDYPYKAAYVTAQEGRLYTALAYTRRNVRPAMWVNPSVLFN